MSVLSRLWKRACSPRFSYLEIFLIYLAVSTVLAFW